MTEQRHEAPTIPKFDNVFAAMQYHHWLLNSALDEGESEEQRIKTAGKFYREHIEGKYTPDEIKMAHLVVFAASDEELYGHTNSG